MTVYIPFLMRLFYLSVLLAVSYVDLRERRIPNRIVVPAILVAVADALWRADVLSSLVGGFSVVAFFAIPAFLGLPGIGIGDLKLAFCIGLILGWPNVTSAIMVATLSGAVVTILGSVLCHWDRHTAIPYGPFLALGALWVLASNLIPIFQ